MTFEIRAGGAGEAGACTVAWTEIAPSQRRLPPPLSRDGDTLVYRFDTVETNAPPLLAAAELLRATAASLRAERYG